MIIKFPKLNTKEKILKFKGKKAITYIQKKTHKNKNIIIKKP